MVKSLIGTVLLPDERATVALATRLASIIGAGDALLLEGDLGAGKTSFARALIRTRVGAAVEVPSPTFTLLQTYEDAECAITHFDLYRIEEANDIQELGWYEARQGIVIVEWPARLGPLRPTDGLTVAFDFAGEGRVAQFRGDKAWQVRVEGIVD